MTVPLNVILSKVFTYSLVHDSIVCTIPILYACLCAVISRQANIINIAAEGIIMFGAFFGFATSYFTGSWILGCLAGILIGVLVSWVMAAAYLKYNVNIFVAGLSINMIATAGTRFLLNTVFHAQGNFVSPKVVPVPKVDFAFLDNSPVLKSLFSHYAVTEWLAFVVVAVIWFMLYKTVWGLRLRAVGQNEIAGLTAGINTKAKKMQALLLSGACAGLGGAHLSIGYSCLFIENMSGGRGFMGMAAMQFGNGNPLSAAIGCLLFGTSQSIANRVAPWGVPNQLINMMPYIVTVLVLTITVVVQQAQERKMNSSLRQADSKKA